jgi:hypothetical protein
MDLLVWWWAGARPPSRSSPGAPGRAETRSPASVGALDVNLRVDAGTTVVLEG